MNALVKTLTVSLVATSFAFAQEDEIDEVESGDSAAEESVEEESAANDQAIPKKPQEADRTFHLLPLCRKLEGLGQVLRPGEKEWQLLEEGKFYPLGCSFRSVGTDSRLTIALGRDCEVEMTGGNSFGTLAQGLAEKTRTVVLEPGTVTVKLPKNMPEGRLIVSAPGFKVCNPAGTVRYEYVKTGDGDEVSVRCVTGSLKIEGRHFTIDAMHAANEVKIRHSQDLLFTALYGIAGDYMVRLDQGLVATHDFENDKAVIGPKELAWKLSPRTAIRIQRAVPAIGERMSVTVMTFDAGGELKNRCSFCEGRYELSTGEEGPVAEADKEALAKKASEAAGAVETVEAVPEDESDETGEGESSAGDSADDELDF